MATNYGKKSKRGTVKRVKTARRRSGMEDYDFPARSKKKVYPATGRKARRRVNPSIAMVKGFVPVQIVGDNLIGKITNPAQKKTFKRLVAKVRRALK